MFFGSVYLLLVYCYMFCKDTKNFNGMQVIMGVNLESCFMLLIFRCDFFCGAKLWCFLGWEGRVKVGNREQGIGNRE